jgi:hypothetical protein
MHHIPPDEEPWKPFRTCLDFEVAELALAARLNKEQANNLFALLRRCQQGENFTIKNHSELGQLWQLASEKCTRVIRVYRQNMNVFTKLVH